jgi:hypothetical protein
VTAAPSVAAAAHPARASSAPLSPRSRVFPSGGGVSASGFAKVLGVRRVVARQIFHFWKPTNRALTQHPRDVCPMFHRAVQAGWHEPYRYRFARIAKVWTDASEGERLAFIAVLTELLEAGAADDR